MNKKKTSKTLDVLPAGDDHRVVTVEGVGQGYCKKPCKNCPWRVDATGEFPAEAFRHSAPTAYDMATQTFACHSTGVDQPSTCAGFLLHGANHNLSVRLGYALGHYQDDVSDGGHELHANYRAMAIANGVLKDDPALEQCRD